MPIQVQALKQRIASVTMPFDGEDVTVTYNAGVITPAFYETLFSSPAREKLAEILVAWDVLQDDGTPWQPELPDHPAWDALAIAARVAQAQAERASAGAEPLADDALQALTAAAPTAAERQDAYRAAWRDILRHLPQPFLLAVLDAIMEDVKPGKKRPAR